MAFLNANVHSHDVVFGQSALYFALNCRTCLKDDIRLGARSGIRADYMVIDTDYRQMFADMAVAEPTTHAFIKHLLGRGDYVSVFRNRFYNVLHHVPSRPPSLSQIRIRTEQSPQQPSDFPAQNAAGTTR
jgi:hypothetical protein